MHKVITVATLVLIAPAFALSNGPQQQKAPPKHFTNSLGMKFVWIPPGNFIMGSPKEEQERCDDEIRHKVTLTKGFYMGVRAITQEQWKEVMGNNSSDFKGEKNLPVEEVRAWAATE